MQLGFKSREKMARRFISLRMKLSEAKVLFALTPFIQGLDLLGLESFFTQIKTFLFWGKVGHGQKRKLS